VISRGRLAATAVCIPRDAENFRGGRSRSWKNFRGTWRRVFHTRLPKSPSDNARARALTNARTSPDGIPNDTEVAVPCLPRRLPPAEKRRAERTRAAGSERNPDPSAGGSFAVATAAIYPIQDAPGSRPSRAPFRGQLKNYGIMAEPHRGARSAVNVVNARKRQFPRE